MAVGALSGIRCPFMSAYVVRRLLSALPVMATVAVIVFLILRLAPGDPATVLGGDQATAQNVEAIRLKLGLDRPLLEQFAIWTWALLRGDFGVSLFSGLPVSRLMAQRLEPTVSLTVATFAIAVSFAVPIGVIAAAKAGT